MKRICALLMTFLMLAASPALAATNGQYIAPMNPMNGEWTVVVTPTEPDNEEKEKKSSDTQKEEKPKKESGLEKRTRLMKPYLNKRVQVGGVYFTIDRTVFDSGNARGVLENPDDADKLLASELGHYINQLNGKKKVYPINLNGEKKFVFWFRLQYATQLFKPICKHLPGLNGRCLICGDDVQETGMAVAQTDLDAYESWANDPDNKLVFTIPAGASFIVLGGGQVSYNGQVGWLHTEGEGYDFTGDEFEWGPWTSNGNRTHTRVCLTDETITVTEDCRDNGEGICEKCGAEYHPEGAAIALFDCDLYADENCTEKIGTVRKGHPFKILAEFINADGYIVKKVDYQGTIGYVGATVAFLDPADCPHWDLDENGNCTVCGTHVQLSGIAIAGEDIRCFESMANAPENQYLFTIPKGDSFTVLANHAEVLYKGQRGWMRGGWDSFDYTYTSEEYEWTPWTSNGNRTHSTVCITDPSITVTEDCMVGDDYCHCYICGAEYHPEGLATTYFEVYVYEDVNCKVRIGEIPYGATFNILGFEIGPNGEIVRKVEYQGLVGYEVATIKFVTEE